jgi:hypothetical protein
MRPDRFEREKGEGLARKPPRLKKKSTWVQFQESRTGRAGDRSLSKALGSPASRPPSSSGFLACLRRPKKKPGTRAAGLDAIERWRIGKSMESPGFAVRAIRAL